MNAKQSIAQRRLTYLRDKRASQLIREIADLYLDEYCDYDRTLADTVSLLVETDADRDAVAVAVLRGLRHKVRIAGERVSERLSPSIADLYRGAERLDALSINVGRGDVQAANSNQRIDFSRILVAMVDDPRVVVIHLAELLVQMRDARRLAESDREALAKQVLSVYAPLANKLGMWRFKWELEDLSFKYLNRPEYDRIVRYLDGRRAEREAYIRDFVDELQSLMHKSDIRAVVNGRAKHLYGIWRKLNRKGVDFDNIFDVRAFRILVDDIGSCYAALGAVHASWPVISGEFDDYVAAPKPNGYQSLHTAIVGPNSKTVEVQIRTWQMHNDCEFGVAAHWLYKDEGKSAAYQEGKIRLLRQLLEWKAEVTESDSDADEDDESLLAKTYAFTPAGKVVELPAFSTPIDFAYYIHTEVGHRCRGARVNDRMVPLTHVLKTGDWVEIQTVKSGGPSRDWLSSSHNFAVSARAKGSIRHWFRLEEYGRYEAEGRALLERELGRHGLSKTNLDKLALSNGFKNTRAFFAAIGAKELKPAAAISSLIIPDPVDPEIRLNRRTFEPESPSLSILGVENLLANHASCCNPLPGDDVIGYITASRGISIHKRSCGNLRRMLESHPDRLLPVDWEYDKEKKYPVDFELLAEGRSGLLQDITASISDSGVSLVSINTPHIRQNEVNRIGMTVEISSALELNKALARLKTVDRVLRVRRL